MQGSPERKRNKSMQMFTVTKREAGQRFDRYLKRLLPQAAGGFLYKMLRKKNITLNGKKAAGNEVIAAGDTVEMFFSEETFFKFSEKRAARKDGLSDGPGSGMRDRDINGGGAWQQGKKAFHSLPDIPVMYEDGNILILNKPAGVLSQKAAKDDMSLNEWMLGYLAEKGELTEQDGGHFRPSVCNRLDRNTSGLVLCGKSVRGSQFLSEMLQHRSLHKYYTAYVRGEIRREIALNGYLRKEAEKNRSQIAAEEEYRKFVMARPEAEKEYKRIETVIKPLCYDRERDLTKLEILLVTGKSHQIRAHLASIGHPVLGDWKYGWKPRSGEEEAFRHQALHACRIEFPQITGEFAYLSGKCITAPEPDFSA